MSGKDPDLLDWLGLRRRPNYSQARWLGPLITVSFILIAVVLVGLTGFEFFKAVAGIDTFIDEAAQSAAIRNSGLVLAAVIGAPFLVWRSFVAQKQVDVAEQGHITDRINKAVEGLGAEKTVQDADGTRTEPNLEVRIGAIYALERIARKSDEDHVQIMEILCAYVRHNSPADSAADHPRLEWEAAARQNMQTSIVSGQREFDKHKPIGSAPNAQNKSGASGPADDDHVFEWVTNIAKPNPDIAACIEVIRRRSPRQIQIERNATDVSPDGYQLDLSHSNLQRANLYKASLFGADLTESRLDGAHLVDADLSGTYSYNVTFIGAHLLRTNLSNAYLDTCRFDCAVLRETSVNAAEFSECIFATNNLKYLDLSPAEVTNCAFQAGYFYGFGGVSKSPVSMQQAFANFGDGSLTIGQRDKWPEHWARDALPWSDFYSLYLAFLVKKQVYP